MLKMKFLIGLLLLSPNAFAQYSPVIWGEDIAQIIPNQLCFQDGTCQSSAGGGGSAVWGDITGDITNQTDLNDALQTKIEVLTGNVTTPGSGSGNATVVSVGGRTATQIGDSVNETEGATSSNTPLSIVKRNNMGAFNSGVITITDDNEPTYFLKITDTFNSVQISQFTTQGVNFGVPISSSQIMDSSPTIAIDLDGHSLYDALNGSPSVQWLDRFLLGSNGTNRYDWENNKFYDINQNDSLYINDRTGLSANGNAQFQWTNAGFTVTQATANTVPYLNADKAIVSSAVTPTQLAKLGGMYFGSFSQAAAVPTTTFTVSIGTTMSSGTYKVNATPSNLISAALFYVNNKTTTTFDVVYLSGLTGTVAFDWSVFP